MTAPASVAPSPGDFACVPMAGAAGFGVSLGEWLGALTPSRWRWWTSYDHVLLYAGWYRSTPAVPPQYLAPGQGRRLGPGHYVFEAMPGGARLRRLPGRPGDIQGALWSTGRVTLAPVQRAAVLAQVEPLAGTPYSAADYLAIAAHRLRLHPLDYALKGYVASSRHMICSQLIDWVYAQAGVQLFTDKRWAGFVDPYDMAQLLLSRTPGAVAA